MTAAPPPPRLIAEAIAELVADDVRDAWHYLDRFDCLSAAGVPRGDRAAALVEPFETDALASLHAWLDVGERAMLAIVGDMGTGKGFAAAQWILDRHSRGLHTTWLATETLPADFKDRDRIIARHRDLSAIVIDDLGAGATSGDSTREQIGGLIKNRIDNLRPTMLIANATAAEMRTWLGDRVLDRLKVAGDVQSIAQEQSLRMPATDDLDPLGRGREWKRCYRLVDLIGCEWADVFAEILDGDGRFVGFDYDRKIGRELRVGGNILDAARRGGHAACKKIRLELGLDAEAVRAKALERGESWMRTLAPVGDSRISTIARQIFAFESACAQIFEAAIEKREAQEAADRAEVRAIVNRATASYQSGRTADTGLRAFEGKQAPAWARGAEGRRKLYACGFRVVPAGDAFAVYHEHGKQRTRKADGCQTIDRGWEIAGILCADPCEDSALPAAESGLRNAG